MPDAKPGTLYLGSYLDPASGKPTRRDAVL